MNLYHDLFLYIEESNDYCKKKMMICNMKEIKNFNI